MNGKLHVHFELSGDFDPQEITRRLSFDPTSTGIKGSRDPLKMQPPFSNWTISSGPFFGRDALEPERITRELLQPLVGKEALIRDVCQDLGAETALAVWLTLESNDNAINPNFRLPPDVIQFLASVNAMIDIDNVVH